MSYRIKANLYNWSLTIATLLLLAGTSVGQIDLFPRSIDQTVYCHQSPGATFDAKVNACIATVIAQGGGVADATGLTGSQTQTAEIDVGTTTVSGVTSNQISVTLKLSPFLFDNVNIQTAGACAFKVFSESRLIGTLAGTSHSATIVDNGSNTGSMVCTGVNGTNGIYSTVQGLILYNPSTGTYTNGLLYALNNFDTSSYSDMIVANYNGTALHVRASCCQTVFRNIAAGGNSSAGAKPVVIESLTGDIQPINGISFIGLSATHPGTGNNTISIKHTYTSGLSPCNVQFLGLYIESNNTDVSSNLIDIDSCQSVQISSFTAQFRATTGGPLTGIALNVHSPSVPAVNPNVLIAGFQYQNSSLMTCPYTVITENFGGATASTNSNCTLSLYTGGDSSSTSAQSTVQFTQTLKEGSGGPSGAAGVDACRGDNTAHAIKCSYNNGTAFPLTQTIASGTAAMPTSSVAAVSGTTITCVAASGNPFTATGTATTDTITFVPNAAPSSPATGLIIQAWPTSGGVNFEYCNPTASALTPSAETLNWRVVR